VFHDYHRDGFYLNSSASAGFSSYESKRKLAFLNQTAGGETQGLSYGGQLATGYDFKVGDFIIGPTASLAYDHAHIDGYGETGSAADLNVGRQNADSLVTALGVHVSRPFAWNRLGWIPEVSLGVSRQHFNPGAITAQFAAGGDRFKVQPQDGGGEFINPGASLTVLGGQGWSVRLGYNAILSPASAEHRVDLSVNAGF
jgi:outer membrane autotransporter protein